MPSISISNAFLEAFAALPRDAQRRTTEFVEEFKNNPRSPGINYENIQRARDRRLKSVRVTGSHRAIVWKPDKGDEFLLLWVDSHDDAYRWAEKRSVEVHPTTGSLQVLIAREEIAPEELPSEPTAHEAGCLFCLSDEQLLRIGVPPSYVTLIGLVHSTDDLHRLGQVLPQEAYEALQLVAEGEPVEAVLEAYEVRRPADPEDIAGALDRPDSKRRFVRVTDEEQLSAMLDAPLAKWRIFLHPSQRKLVDRESNGPVKVLGGPGTGKTVVALHRACHLAKKAGQGGGDILLTTYTRNLATDLGSMVKELEPHLGSVKVEHLHGWVYAYCRAHGVEARPLDDKEALEMWEEALSLTDSSLSPEAARREWEDVILCQSVGRLDEYLMVNRKGAKGRMDALDRRAFWDALNHYRRRCESAGVRDWMLLVHQARLLLESDSAPRPYRHVVVDEAQDFQGEEWRLIRALVSPGKDDMFVVGDAHQRIYGRRVVLLRCGIDTRGRSQTLKVNYRTTREIKNWATAVYRGRPVDDLDEASEDLRGYTSLLSGSSPRVLGFTSEEEESDSLAQLISGLLKSRPAEGVCVAARTHDMVNRRVAEPLRKAGIPVGVLDARDRPKVGEITAATMHRIKGTEFPVMVIVGAEEGSIPLLTHSDGPEREQQELALFFAAATRSREELVVTHVGLPSRFLSPVGVRTT